MQRSSETIGTIAAALAKAQAQLINPEKSLVGVIRFEQAGGAENSETQGGGRCSQSSQDRVPGENEP